MPQIKSAKKRIKQSEKKATRNRQIENRTKNALKKFRGLINPQSIEQAKQELPSITALIDSTASKGVWHKNKAARIKARLMKKMNTLNEVS